MFQVKIFAFSARSIEFKNIIIAFINKAFSYNKIMLLEHVKADTDVAQCPKHAQ